MNSALAQIKNECIADEGDHLLMMENMPDHRFFCVDARFLTRCQGPENGKVTLVSSYQEMDGYSGEFGSSIAIYSKTDSQIKIAPGRIATAIKKKNQYLLFSGLEGYMNGTYLTTAEARINGEKVKAVKSGSIRKNTYLLEVLDKVKRVLRNLEDPCQREIEESREIEKEETLLSCKLENIEDALKSGSFAEFEAALSGFDHKHNIAYAVVLDHKTQGIYLVEFAFDDFCRFVEGSIKNYVDIKEFFSKLEGPTVNKSLVGVIRGKELISKAKKSFNRSTRGETP